MGQAPTCLINTIQSFFKYSFEKYWKQYCTKILTLKKESKAALDACTIVVFVSAVFLRDDDDVFAG